MEKYHYVKPKKHLGQHFLTNSEVAKKIVGSLSGQGYQDLLEIGPGTGALTQHILNETSFSYRAMEVDRESVAFLLGQYPTLQGRVLETDFLRVELNNLYQLPLAVIGNFPYNISSQILFKILAHRHQVVEMVGMFQKEVAERIVASPNNKVYGILSVLTQAFYNTEKLFIVNEGSFNPPPRVKSMVIRLRRNQVSELACDETMFFKVVKLCFNQRRKMIINPLKSQFGDQVGRIDPAVLKLRAENLTVQDYVAIVNALTSRP